MVNEMELGRLQQSVTQMEEDIREIKTVLKDLSEFVAEQKAGRRYMWMFFTSVGAIIIFFKDIISFIETHLYLKH